MGDYSNWTTDDFVTMLEANSWLSEHEGREVLRRLVATEAKAKRYRDAFIALRSAVETVYVTERVEGLLSVLANVNKMIVAHEDSAPISEAALSDLGRKMNRLGCNGLEAIDKGKPSGLRRVLRRLVRKVRA